MTPPAGAQKKHPYIEDYTIKKAKIRWRNFEGREERFNAKGDRNFTIFLTPHDSERLTEMGLNVKTLPARPDAEEGTPQQDILKVKVKFGPNNRPPRVVLVTHRGRTMLGENEMMMVDAAEIARVQNAHGETEEMVDLILSPYWWDNNGKEGIAVSLKAIYITIVEDELEMMYGDIPEATGALRGRAYTADEDPEEAGPQFR